MNSCVLGFLILLHDLRPPVVLRFQIEARWLRIRITSVGKKIGGEELGSLKCREVLTVLTVLTISIIVRSFEVTERRTTTSTRNLLRLHFAVLANQRVLVRNGLVGDVILNGMVIQTAGAATTILQGCIRIPSVSQAVVDDKLYYLHA